MHKSEWNLAGSFSFVAEWLNFIVIERCDFTLLFGRNRSYYPYHLQTMFICSCLCLPTGFSLGGLLACSIATQIWLSRHISSRHLQENLVCITFAQPHIPVPQLAAVVREFPEIASTIHAIYNKEDPVPRLMKFLDLPVSSIIRKSRRKPPPVSH